MKISAIFFMVLALCEYINGTETYKGSDYFEIPLFIITAIICIIIDAIMIDYGKYKKEKNHD